MARACFELYNHFPPPTGYVSDTPVTPDEQGSDTPVSPEEHESDTAETQRSDHSKEASDQKSEQASANIRKEEELLRTCEKVIRDKDSVDYVVMNGIMYGLPRSGKSSLIQRLTGRMPLPNSPSTLVAEQGVQVSIEDVHKRAGGDITVVVEGGDASTTSHPTWRLVEGLDDEAVLLMNDFPQVATSTSSMTTKPSSASHHTDHPTGPTPNVASQQAPEATQQAAPEAPKQPPPRSTSTCLNEATI